jgi:hypothetical protein
MEFPQFRQQSVDAWLVAVDDFGSFFLGDSDAYFFGPLPTLCMMYISKVQLAARVAVELEGASSMLLSGTTILSTRATKLPDYICWGVRWSWRPSWRAHYWSQVGIEFIILDSTIMSYIYLVLGCLLSPFAFMGAWG